MALASPLVRAREALASIPHGEALLVTDPSNVQWLTGFTGTFGQVLIGRDIAVFITDSRYRVQAAEQVKGFDVRSFSSPQSGKGFLAETVKTLGLSSLGFEAGHLTYRAFEEYRDALGVELVSVPEAIAPLRMIKSPEQIAALREACSLADKAFEHVSRLFQVGVTEFEIHLELEFFIRRHRADLAFEPIVVSGANSARPHGHATEKPLAIGDFVTLDFGARVKGMNSDLTRTVVIGEPTPRHREVYEQVLKAQLAVLEAMKPGVTGHEMDALSRDVLNEKDLAQYFGHGLGHGLGTVVHDSGRLGNNSKDVLAEGQVWTVEPGVYIEGFGGVRIEDDVVVTSDGIEILTYSPKELLVFGA